MKEYPDHVDFDQNFQRKPVEVFKWSINPYVVMSICTFSTIVMYIIFLVVGLDLPIEDQSELHYGLPSVSAIIAFSKAMTISFTLIVYLHSYGLYCYLIILAEYLGKDSFQFIATAAFCILYIICLIVVTYLPLTFDETKHNIFAVSAFVFALCSVYLHKYSFVVYGERGYTVSNKREGFLLILELISVVTISLSGALFWFRNYMWAEYLFILLILIDKQVKVFVLTRLNLLYLEGSYIQYSYFSPPNPLDPNYVNDII